MFSCFVYSGFFVCLFFVVLRFELGLVLTRQLLYQLSYVSSPEGILTMSLTVSACCEITCKLKQSSGDSDSGLEWCLRIGAFS
jgi:hypothetical protein